MRTIHSYIITTLMIGAMTLTSHVHAQQEWEYAVFEVSGLGDRFTNAWGVDDDGVVVGASFPTGQNVFHAYVWDGKRTIDLGTFEGPDSEAWDVNQDGAVVGWADTPIAKPHAFVWDPESGMIDLGTFGGSSSKAYGINEQGVVVGSANFEGDSTAHAFRWEGDEKIDLGSLDDSRISFAWDINELGVIVGESNNGQGVGRPVMWKDDEIFDLGSLGDGTNRGTAYAINDLNQIVGVSYDDREKFYPFIWQDGTMYRLTSKQGQAYSINNHSQVVGSVFSKAFIWEPGKGLRFLEDMFPAGARQPLRTGTEITDSGMFSAWGPLLDSKAFLFVPVDPELTLSDPIPGRVGTINTWTVSGARPGSRVFLTYSQRGGGTVVPGCDKLQAVVQLEEPKIMKSSVADANGEATIQMYVPPAARNVGDILFQAVSVKDCEESQLVVFDFE